MSDRMPAPIIAATVWAGSPQIIELAGQSGFEWLVVETEHSPFSSFESVESQFRAARAGGMAPIASLPKASELEITKVCEAGAVGLIVAHTVVREDAERIVRAAMYPPLGRRGTALSVRQVGYDVDRSGWPARADRINAEMLLLGKIEDPEALDNLDDILSTDIGGLFFGAFDMSHGIARLLDDPTIRGRIDHPMVIEARDRVIDRCAAAGKPSGVVLGQLQVQEDRPARELVEDFGARGVRLFTLPSELDLLRESYCRILADLG
jgi:4-hydroxy-2-oxoheptanedioate aldolase